jgi:hypothetical protein
MAFWRQAFGFALRQIDHQRQLSLWYSWGVEQSDKARLNQA